MGFKNKIHVFKKSYMAFACVFILVLLAVFLVWFNNSTSKQAQSATSARVYFEGEYRIADGEWQSIESGGHISATKGDVTLRLKVRLTDPDGNPMDDTERIVPLALYTDHIGLTFYSGGKKVRVIDNENPVIGESACGESWTMHTVKTGGTEPLEIVVHNPHVFGNETAIDEMLSKVAIWANIDFEKDVLNSGEPQRNMGMLFVLVSLVFLGIALFSTLIHIKNNKIILLLGAMILFAGLHIAYTADGVSFWSESIISNTTILGCSMMFYMLFLSISICYFLKASKMIGELTVILLVLANAVFFLLPIVSNVFFYDVWIWWVAIQTVANLLFLFCLTKEFVKTEGKERWLYISMSFPLLAFFADVVGTWIGAWKGGIASRYVFVALFAVALIMVLKLIPNNINAAAKAKELEMEKIVLSAELSESRISTMMSQIRPHFIYNTLGSIEQLCKLDPPKAGELVHNFAKYLRGNFGELDNPKPILMSQEMEHVRHYINIENVRFPDMTFTFEMNSDDFHIPALTIQPIVENAIKHGLMKLPRGGTIRVEAYETDTDYCVCVIDDGVGFDTGTLFDDRKHVGIRNIRERLKVIVNGTLDIKSTPGVGTRVLITIPKEGRG